jgi:hypothetical protein
MTKYNKNAIPAPPKAPKISLEKVYKYNRIYDDRNNGLRVQVFENDTKFYLVYKGKILTFSDHNECFEAAKRISKTGR